MSEASDRNPDSASSPSLLHMNGDMPTAEAQAALREINRLVAASAQSPTPDDSLAEAMQVLAQLAPLHLQPQVQPSAVPIFGGLITRLKRALHQLILFYLNDLAAQQSAFNHQLLNVLQNMTKPLERR